MHKCFKQRFNRNGGLGGRLASDIQCQKNSRYGAFFHPKPVVPPPLRCMNVDIKDFVEHSHLGLTFTSNLKWSFHINNISIEAIKKLLGKV